MFVTIVIARMIISMDPGEDYIPLSTLPCQHSSYLILTLTVTISLTLFYPRNEHTSTTLKKHMFGLRNERTNEW